MRGRRKGPKGEACHKRGRHRRAEKKLRPSAGKQICTAIQAVWLAVRLGDVLTKHEGPVTHRVSRALAELVDLINGL